MKINTALCDAVVNHTHTYKAADIRPYSTFEIPPLYTLVAKPPETIKKKISEISYEIQKRYPEHYYYLPVQYHVTLLPLEVEVDSSVITTLQKILRSENLEVMPKGISINPHGISMPVYIGENYSLRVLRNKLRKVFGTALNYTEHNAVWDELLWVNFMRFKTQPEPDFFNILAKYEDIHLDTYKITHWDLYKTSSKVLEADQSTLVHSFTI